MLAPVGEGVAANWEVARGPAPPPKGGGKRKGGGANGGNNGTWSPRSCLLVRDFLVPCLDSRCYGNDLQWINRQRGIFLIRWTHQGSKSFNREGPNVFRDWSILKRKWDEQDPNRLSKAKQRVRAAFRKLPNVRRINDGAAPHRIYRIKDIGVYLKPWKEPKEKKRKKKPRQPCGCAPGDPSCRHLPRGHPEQEQGAASSTGAEDNDVDDDDDDYNYMEVGEEDYREEDYGAPLASESAVSLTTNGGVWSSLHSLTEGEVDRGSEDQDESLSPTWGPADMEAVQALLSIRHSRPLPPMTAPTQVPAVAPPGGGGGTVAPLAAAQSSQPATALTTTACGTDPMAVQRTQAKDQSTVSAELRVGGGRGATPYNGVATPPAEGEASLAPHIVHMLEELVAAAMSSALWPAQPAAVTGDSPHMFWADAGPARPGEQPEQKQLHTMEAASVERSCLQGFGVEPEPVASYEVACSVATGTAAHSGGWTDQPSAYSSSSSSWRDRNEPLRPDGCWTTR